LSFLLKLISALIGIFVLFLAGFFYIPVSHNANFDVNEEITLYMYNKSRPINKIVIPPNSDVHVELNNWLNSNNSNWNHDINSYAPSIYVRSKGISLNLFKSSSVLSYAQFSDSRHTQITQVMDNELIRNKLSLAYNKPIK